MIASTTAADLVDALRTAVRTGRATRQAAAFGELPGSSATTLAVLERDGEQRLGHLAERLAVDPSVMSRQVAALTRAGLAARRPDPVDGRAQLLCITAAGCDALDRYRSEWVAWVAQALGGWNDNDAQDLVAALHRLTHDLRQAPGTTSLPQLTRTTVPTAR